MKDCPRGNRVKDGVNCKWTGCNGKYPSLYKLRDHMKCHTKEKIVACPDCGATFASKTKFHTHCQRQIPLEGNKLILYISNFFCTLYIFCLKYNDSQYRDSNVHTAISFIPLRKFYAII